MFGSSSRVCASFIFYFFGFFGWKNADFRWWSVRLKSGICWDRLEGRKRFSPWTQTCCIRWVCLQTESTDTFKTDANAECSDAAGLVLWILLIFRIPNFHEAFEDRVDPVYADSAGFQVISGKVCRYALFIFYFSWTCICSEFPDIVRIVSETAVISSECRVRTRFSNGRT